MNTVESSEHRPPLGLLLAPLVLILVLAAVVGTPAGAQGSGTKVAVVETGGRGSTHYRAIGLELDGRLTTFEPRSQSAVQAVRVAAHDAGSLSVSTPAGRLGSEADGFAALVAEVVSSTTLDHSVRFGGGAGGHQLDMMFTQRVGAEEYLLVQELGGDGGITLTGLDATGSTVGTPVVVGPDYDLDTGHRASTGDGGSYWVAAVPALRLSSDGAAVAGVRVTATGPVDYKLVPLTAAPSTVGGDRAALDLAATVRVDEAPTACVDQPSTEGPVTVGQQVLLCLEVTNTGSVPVDRLRFSDPGFELDVAEAELVSGSDLLVPGATGVYAVAVEVDNRPPGAITSVTGRPVSVDGRPVEVDRPKAVSGLRVAVDQPTTTTESAASQTTTSTSRSTSTSATTAASTTASTTTPTTTAAPATTTAPTPPSTEGSTVVVQTLVPADEAATTTTSSTTVTTQAPPTTAADATDEAEAGSAGAKTATTATTVAATPQPTVAVDPAADLPDPPAAAVTPVDDGGAATAQSAAADFAGTTGLAESGTASGAMTELPFTGPVTEPWVLVLLGTGFIFFGYTIVAAFRRRPADRGHALLDALGFD